MTSQATREFMAFTMCLFAMVMILGHCINCTPPKNALEAAAEGTYAAELQACVAQYAKDADIDRCAERVRARWAADGGAK